MWLKILLMILAKIMALSWQGSHFSKGLMISAYDKIPCYKATMSEHIET